MSNDQTTAAVPARWYCVDRDGVATLCADEADARRIKADHTRLCPKHAPHVAVLLGDVAAERASRQEAQIRLEEMQAWAATVNRDKALAASKAEAAERERWESAIGAVMPADFKQWHNSPSERPETAAWCITRARELEQLAWDQIAARDDIHTELSRIYSRLAGAVRAGADDATLACLLRAEIAARKS